MYTSPSRLKSPNDSIKSQVKGATVSVVERVLAVLYYKTGLCLRKMHSVIYFLCYLCIILQAKRLYLVHT